MLKFKNLKLLPFLWFLTAQASPTKPLSIPLYNDKIISGATVMVGDFYVQQPLKVNYVRVTDDPKMPGAMVEGRQLRKADGESALGLSWKNAWFSTIRMQTKPLDLRPYIADGTVSFDLKVNELAKGGLSLRLDCGKDCERKVNYVIPPRGAQGRGWKRVAFALSCFYHQGDDFSAVTQPFALDGTNAGDIELTNVRIDARGVANETCPDYRTASITAVPLNESWSLDWWIPRHDEKLAEIARRKAAGETTNIVFIGDSITHNWEKEHDPLWNEMWKVYHPLNLGFSGDRTETALWRLQHGEIDNIDPKLVIVLIGTNNSGQRGDAPIFTYSGIKRNIEEIRKHLPRTKILLLAIFPRGENSSDVIRQTNEKVNAMLPDLVDGEHVFLLNIGKAFLAADGSLSKDIFPDLLHPNDAGYRIWQHEMQPEIDSLMK